MSACSLSHHAHHVARRPRTYVLPSSSHMWESLGPHSPVSILSCPLRIAANRQLHRKIRDLSLKFSKEVHAICYPESPWELGQDLSMDQMRTLAEMTRYQGSAVRDFCTKKPVNKRKAKVIHAEPERPRRRSASPEAEESSSGGDSDDEATFKKLNDDLTLRRRGKGSYTCPKGRRCKKGGVDSTGEPIQFDRNSAFL